MKVINCYTIVLALILITLTSCSKVVDLKLNNASGQLVIEGNLTNINGRQSIQLSQNVSFMSSNSYPPVSGATVTINDQAGNSYALVEGPAGIYSVNNAAGIAGNTYTMRVSTNGRTYTANSVMPQAVQLDSIAAQNEETRRGKNKKEITVYYKDPAGLASQYRFIEYINGVQVNTIFVFDDRFTDGKNVNNVLRESDIDIYPGDTVTVEMQCINKDMYTYWLTLKQEGGNNVRQQTVAPSNPPTNITPTTLGYFSAHTSQTITMVVP